MTVARTGQLRSITGLNHQRVWTVKMQYPMVRLVGWGLLFFMAPLCVLMWLGAGDPLHEIITMNFALLVWAICVDRGFVFMMRKLSNPMFAAAFIFMEWLMIMWLGMGDGGQAYEVSLFVFLFSWLLVGWARLMPAGLLDITMNAQTLTPKGRRPIPLEEIDVLLFSHGNVHVLDRRKKKHKLGEAIRHREFLWLQNQILRRRDERQALLHQAGHDLDTLPAALQKLQQTRQQIT